MSRIVLKKTPHNEISARFYAGAEKFPSHMGVGATPTLAIMSLVKILERVFDETPNLYASLSEMNVSWEGKCIREDCMADKDGGWIYCSAHRMDMGSAQAESRTYRIDTKTTANVDHWKMP